MMKLIPGFTDYCVSDEGNVYRIKKDSLYQLKTYICGGHNCVKLRGKKFYIDNLVALVFIGDKPDYTKVFHKNKDKLDDRLENLVYLSLDKFYMYSTYTKDYLKSIFG